MKWNRLRTFLRGKPAGDLTTTRAQAEAGDAEAQVGMARTCGGDAENAADACAAAAWYRKAAEQNHAHAQFSLGLFCAEGRGVPRNEAEAHHWLRKAALQGHMQAQFHLGIRCQRATFGPRTRAARESRIEAYKWLRLAADQGSQESVAAWEQVVMSMTAEEVAEGNRRTCQFVAAAKGAPAGG
jgi:hypothetical protein